MAGASPQVAVVLVNWNGPNETLACIRSLASSELPVWRIYVVDNASSDDSVERLRQATPEIRLVRAERNLGYAGGFNLAWPTALRDGADYIWLLNNDTLVSPTCLRHLLEAAENVGTAVLSPQIRYHDRPDQAWYLGGRLDWRMKTSHLTDRSGGWGAEGLRPVPVEWATGCSLFVPGEVLEKIGGMDERYFLYLEDVDWSLTARRKGVGIYTVPQAIIYHSLASSVKRLDPWHLHYYSWRNYYLFAQNHGAWWQRAYAYTDLAVRLAKTVVRLLLFPSYRRDQNYLARSRGLVDFARGRFGEFPAEARPLPSPSQQVAT